MAAQQAPQAAVSSEDPKTIDEARAALRAAETAHPGETTQVAKALIDLIYLESMQGAMTDEVAAHADRAVRVAESAEGKNSSIYAQALGAKAHVLMKMDRSALARSTAEDAVAIERKLGSDPGALADVAGVLADVCTKNGDGACAIRAAEEQVRALQSSKTPDPLRLASAWASVLWAHRRMYAEEKVPDLTRAREAANEILAIAKDSETDRQEWALIELQVGGFYIGANECASALPHLRKAEGITTRLNGPDTLSLSTIVWDLGYAEMCTGDATSALRDFGRARELVARRYGPTHSQAARVNSSYGYTLSALGRYKEAIDTAIAAHTLHREHIRLAIQLMPENEALAMATTGDSAYDVLLSVATRHPDVAPADAYQEVVRSRALVADELAHRQAALKRANDPGVRTLERELEQQRKIVLELQGRPSSAQTEAALQSASEKLVRAERELATRSMAFRSEVQAHNTTVAELRRHLPRGSVLVSYVVYWKHGDTAGSFNATPTISCTAFVLHTDSQRIGVYDLGELESLRRLVLRMRAAGDAEAHGGGVGSTRNEREYREAGEELRKRIWDPLAADIGGARLVMVVPDDVLNLVPFSSLPVAKGYLVEHGPVVHVLSSERDLVPDIDGTKKTGLLVVGSPNFGLPEAGPGSASLRDAPVECDAFRSIQFQALPNSLEEVRDISGAWKQWNTQEPQQLLTGQKATSGEFLKAAPQSRVLHIATHAFVLDQSCGTDNPLLHSGLVFAGANQSRENSIVTAEQIASLDLQGMDWAVLSACNTGNGELRHGEGVLGLQRAFRVAGARSIIMALWSVDDAVTRDFMRRLYAARFGNHASTADAVWLSVRSMLRERRSAGQSTHPWYWAGFVGSGAWE